jgi:hypothetical protein
LTMPDGGGVPLIFGAVPLLDDVVDFVTVIE